MDTNQTIIVVQSITILMLLLLNCAVTARFVRFVTGQGEKPKELADDGTWEIGQRAEEFVKCQACGNEVTSTPVETRVSEEGTLVVFRCEHCQEFIGVPASDMLRLTRSTTP